MCSPLAGSSDGGKRVPGEEEAALAGDSPALATGGWQLVWPRELLLMQLKMLTRREEARALEPPCLGTAGIPAVTLAWRPSARGLCSWRVGAE